MPSSKSNNDKDVKRYMEEVNRLLTQVPDPTSLMLLKGHALVDDWLQRYVLFVNAIRPLDPDDPRLCSLSPVWQALFANHRPQLPVTLNFMGKLREVEKLKIIPKEVVAAMERLNKIRNDYAHDFDTRITRQQIEFVLHSLLQDQSFRERHEKGTPSGVDDFRLMGFVLIEVLTVLFVVHTVGGVIKNTFDDSTAG
jgi:hypothetical protein